MLGITVFPSVPAQIHVCLINELVNCTKNCIYQEFSDSDSDIGIQSDSSSDEEQRITTRVYRRRLILKVSCGYSFTGMKLVLDCNANWSVWPLLGSPFWYGMYFLTSSFPSIIFRLVVERAKLPQSVCDIIP